MVISYVSTKKSLVRTNALAIENKKVITFQFSEDSCNAVEIFLKPDHSAA
jgi:hypothetical protein